MTFGIDMITLKTVIEWVTKYPLDITLEINATKTKMLITPDNRATRPLKLNE